MLSENLIAKFQQIAARDIEKCAEFGFTPDKGHLSLTCWLRITPDERYEIMQLVEQPKTLKVFQNRCMKVIEQYI